MKGEFEYKGIMIGWLEHASIRIIANNMAIYIDPFAGEGYEEKADLILITHDHADHCCPELVAPLLKEGTRIITVQKCARKLQSGVEVIMPGGKTEFQGIGIEVVHAYNISKPYHPRSAGVGFILNIDGTRIYHAGDTDYIPEMKELGEIDVALLPIGGTYTMNEEEAAEAANAIQPKVAVPIHYNYITSLTAGTEADPNKFAQLVGEGIEVKILGGV